MKDITIETCHGFNAVVLVIPDEFIQTFALDYPETQTGDGEQQQAAFEIIETLGSEAGLVVDGLSLYCYQRRPDGCILSVIHPSFPACEPYSKFPERFVRNVSGAWKILTQKEVQ